MESKNQSDKTGTQPADKASQAAPNSEAGKTQQGGGYSSEQEKNETQKEQENMHNERNENDLDADREDSAQNEEQETGNPSKTDQ